MTLRSAALTAFAILCFAVPPASAETLPRGALAERIGDGPISFRALDLATGDRCDLEGSDVNSRHAPWSTFKIPNLLIALETGVAGDLTAARRWDPERRPAASFWPEAWRRDHTLDSAFRASAVWYFRDLALDVGAPAYRDSLTGWRYGNAAVPDGADDFWLGGPLRISVSEQVDFLAALLGGRLDVSDEALSDLSAASAEWCHRDLSLHGKTGAGTLVPGDFSAGFEGWYVGWVARQADAPAVFALYLQTPDFDTLRTARKATAIDLLKACGILPEDAPD